MMHNTPTTRGAVESILPLRKPLRSVETVTKNLAEANHELGLYACSSSRRRFLNGDDCLDNCRWHTLKIFGETG